MKLTARLRVAFMAGMMLLTAAPPAHAGATAIISGSGTWRFFGNCIDCANGLPGITRVPVTGSLTLQNYLQGMALSNDNFVSFTYDGSNLISAFTVDRTNLSPSLPFVALSGEISEGGPQDFYLQFGQDGYFSLFNGNWSTCPGVGGECSAPADFGDAGRLELQSQVVPEPATYALTAFGLGVIGVGARRRRRPA